VNPEIIHFSTLKYLASCTSRIQTLSVHMVARFFILKYRISNFDGAEPSHGNTH
jgi:hypothetical protein